MPLDVLTLYMVPSGYEARCENQAQRPSFQRNITNFGTQSVWMNLQHQGNVRAETLMIHGFSRGYQVF